MMKGSYHQYMGRGADGNPLYGVVLPRGSQQPLSSPDSPQAPQPRQTLGADGKMVPGTQVRLLKDEIGLSKGALGVVESCDSITGSYWIQFYGQSTADVISPSFIEHYSLS